MSILTGSYYVQPNGAETRRTISVDKLLRICNNMNKGRNNMTNANQETLYHALFMARHLNRCAPREGLVYILLELQLPAHRIGYHYLIKAILLFYNNPVGMLLAGIYQTIIAELDHPITYRKLEQDIRVVIEAGYRNCDPRVWGYYFRRRRELPAGRPSNFEFIAQIASFLELWQSCCKEASYEN